MIFAALNRIRSGVAGRLALFGASLLLGFGQGALAFNYQQGFEDWATDNTPPPGWLVGYSQSSSVDNPQWNQGDTYTSVLNPPYPPGTDPLGFDAQAGTPRSFANISWAAGYIASTDTWTFINSWLFSPVLDLNNGDTVEFYARQTDYYAINDPTGPQYPNSLELRLSTNGASTDIGTTPTSVGDFTTLLVSINPTLTDTGFPSIWTKYSATVTGLTGTVQGRFGLQYALDAALGYGSYIGVDSFSTSASLPPPPVPEPSSFALIGIGLAGLAYRRHRSKKQG